MKFKSFTPLLILALLLFATTQTRAQQSIVPQRPLGQMPISAPSSQAPAPGIQFPAQSGMATTTAASVSPEKTVSVQFPHTSVLDILNFYEQLTGKRTIRDSNLAGPELSIVVANEIPQHEAVALIESSLLLNGYTLIPVDDKTVKILGPSRPGRAEGLPLYLEESQLPQEGDKLVSFYKPLHFLNPDEAISIIDGVVQRNAFGSLAGVPNTSALVITDKTPIIRKIIAILDVVDKEPSQIITEFIPLQRANAEKVVETLNTMFGGTSGGGGGSHPTGAPQGNQGASVTTGGDVHLLSGKPQFIADKRTNRVLIVVKAENYKYLRELIAKLDQPDDFAEPLVRPLNYLPVDEIYPVLTDMLKGKDEGESGKPGSAPTPAPTPRSTPPSNIGGSGSSSSASGVPSATIDDIGSAEETTPQSTTVGNVSIITDPHANSIIVYGPSDVKAKAKQIIDLLDQRPKQVYLAAVIGQLQLTEGMDYGANWFAKLSSAGGGSGSNNLIGAAANGAISGFLTNLVTGSLNNAVNSFPSSLAGLTVFGAVTKEVFTYAHFLETTGKFRTISRPVVYTSNNKKAVILSGQAIPYAGSTLSTVVNTTGNNNSGSSINSTVQYQNANLELDIIPLINADNDVELRISQINNTQQGSTIISGNAAPNIDTQKLTTTVRVPNGSTIVLGGLISDAKTTDDSGIPYINRIPVIGPLLGGTTKKSKTRNELVIMIQPIVVDSNETMQKASIEEGADSELGRRAQTIKDRLEPTPSPTPKKKGFHLFQMKKIDNF